MKTFTCAQKLDEFEAEEAPTNCPVCLYPFVDASDVDKAPTGLDHDGTLPWETYTIDELRDYASNWDVEGWDDDTPKAELIALLEAAEAADESEDGE